MVDGLKNTRETLYRLGSKGIKVGDWLARKQQIKGGGTASNAAELQKDEQVGFNIKGDQALNHVLYMLLAV